MQRSNLSGLREILADQAHESWRTWMFFLMKQSFTIFGYTIIPPTMTKRWIRQMHTKYFDLSEPERESDRKEADKVMDRLIEGYRHD